MRLLQWDFEKWYNEEQNINNSCCVVSCAALGQITPNFDVDRDGQCWSNASCYKRNNHIQPLGIFTPVTSWTVARYRCIIFAQEEKYAALITAWGNTSQHLPALARWKISTCWGSWLRWIVVFRVLDTGGSGRPPEPAYNENHTGAVSLPLHLWVSRPRRDAKERSCMVSASGVVVVGEGPWPFTNISAESNSGDWFACVCVCFLFFSVRLCFFFFVCPRVFKCIQGCSDIALLLMYNIYV